VRRLPSVLEGAHRVVGELEVVAPAGQQAECPFALAICGRRPAEAPAQQVHGGAELVVAEILGERRRDDLLVDAELAEAALDAIAAPGIEAPAILGEAAREAGVVEHVEALELGHRRVDGALSDVAALEVAAHLGHRAVTVAEEPEAQVERCLELCPVRHDARYAAWLIAGAAGPASAGAPASAAAAASIGSTASRSMASAS
jgi:hypothetical protein